ncbi:MAG: hypothetical protein Tsb002_33840 [Wenzhouxiangellaceae bacterium]
MPEVKTAFAIVQVEDSKTNPNPDVLSSFGIESVNAESDRGRFHIQFASGFFNTIPAVVVTEIYNGTNDGKLAPVTCRGYSGGSSKDNAVVICVESKFCRIKTGDSDGDGRYRSFSIAAHGF